MLVCYVVCMGFERMWVSLYVGACGQEDVVSRLLQRL